MARTTRKSAEAKQSAPSATPAKRTESAPVTERVSAADIIAQAEANVAKLADDPTLTDATRESRARRERFTAATLLSGYPQSDLSSEARAYVVEHAAVALAVVDDAEQVQRSIAEQYKQVTTQAEQARALMAAYAYGVTSVSKLITQAALARQWYPDASDGMARKSMSTLVAVGRIAAKVGATPKQIKTIANLVNKPKELVGSKEALDKIVAESSKFTELQAAVKRVKTERELAAARSAGVNGGQTGTERPRRDPDQDVRSWLPNEAEAMTQALVKAAKAKLVMEAAKDGATPTEALRNLRTAIDQYLTSIGEAVTA